jgi:hypothetical protein
MPNISLGPFSLDVPVDWSLRTLILAGPVDKKLATVGTERFSSRPFQRNIVVTIERVEGAETVESYVQHQIDGLRRARIQRWEKANPEQVSLPNGLSGLLTEQVIVGPENDRVRQMQLVIIKNRLAYTLVASHLEGDLFEESRQDFRKMLLSFR